jgi:hypothetical protein
MLKPSILADEGVFFWNIKLQFLVKHLTWGIKEMLMNQGWWWGIMLHTKSRSNSGWWIINLSMFHQSKVTCFKYATVKNQNSCKKSQSMKCTMICWDQKRIVVWSVLELKIGEPISFTHFLIMLKEVLPHLWKSTLCHNQTCSCDTCIGVRYLQAALNWFRVNNVAKRQRKSPS